MPAAELPAPLLNLSKDEQKAQLKKTAAKREQLQQEIAKLGKQRQDYIAETLEEEAVAQSLDGKIYEAIRSQAGNKGLIYESKPLF